MLPSDEVSPDLSGYAERWGVTIERVVETRTSVIGYGTRGSDPVVLKLARGDETDSGAIAAAFEGHGVVRVHEHESGAALLERLMPGTQLSDLAIAGHDERATDALAQVIGAMREINPPIDGFPTLEQWGSAFDRYIEGGDRQIPGELVQDAQARYRKLCETQGTRRLLHGDLQHYNILADDARGWTAIDPKGVVGELEFELCAALRNPHESLEFYSVAEAVERRVQQLCAALRLDPARVIEWAYAAGVLSAIWTFEDDGIVSPMDPALCLVAAIRPLV